MRSRHLPIPRLLLVAASLAACSPSPSDRTKPQRDDSSADDSSPDTEDSLDDSGDSGDDTGDPPSRIDDVFGVPNLDDDDRDRVADWSQLGEASGDNERAGLRIPASLLAPATAKGGSFSLTLRSGQEDLRVWSEGSVVLGATAGGSITRVEVPASAEDVLYEVEFRDLLSEGWITARAERDGAETWSAEVRLLASPYVHSHHGLAAEALWAVESNYWGVSNSAMIDELESTLGSLFVAINGSRYLEDVWVQDEFDFGTLLSPDGRVDYILDSVRNREIDPYDEAEWLEPDVVIASYGRPSTAASFDYFGNLEATPPLEAEGVSYPLGRVYYGGEGRNAPQAELLDFLDAQRVQPPLAWDSSWLCVGHIDEFVSFVPDPTRPKGFKVAIADVDAAWDLIDGLSASQAIPRYRTLHGYSTIGGLQEDRALRSLNEDIQKDEVDPVRERIMADLDLEEDDFIRVPALWEEPRGCGRYVAALIPGIVNLAVFGTDPEHPYLLIADPYLRGSGEPESSDPLIAALASLWPPTATPVYLDDWNVYHAMLGEVHCGSVTRRTPSARWWESALSLIGGAR